MWIFLAGGGCKSHLRQSPYHPPIWNPTNRSHFPGKAPGCNNWLEPTIQFRRWVSMNNTTGHDNHEKSSSWAPIGIVVLLASFRQLELCYSEIKDTCTVNALYEFSIISSLCWCHGTPNVSVNNTHIGIIYSVWCTQEMPHPQRDGNNIRLWPKSCLWAAVEYCTVWTEAERGLFVLMS